MKPKWLIPFLFLGVALGAKPLEAQLTGSTGGTGLPQASGSGQCVVSTGAGVNYIAGSCGSGNLPALGSGGTVLFQNAAGTAATWATCAGDATCSAVTPGSFTVVAIRGNAVKSGTPADAAIYIYNSTNNDLESVNLSGDFTITHAGVGTVAGTHITGAVTGGLPRYGAGGTLGNATACSDYVSATSGTAIQKALNGCLTPAVSGQDYAPATSGTSLLKGNNLGGFNNAVAKTDYAPATTGTVNTPLFNDGAGGTTNGTVSGSTTEVTSFSGVATPGRCLRLDTNGNASIAAGDCSAGVGFINTPTVIAGAATAIAQCASPGCTDYNRIANGTNVGTLTLTTPTSTSMNDGEELSVEVDNDGTHQPSSISWAAGTGVTLAYGNLGAGQTAVICGTAAATGYEMYNWLWNATSGKLTLHDCGPVPAATTVSVALGGTGSAVGSLNNALKIANDATTGTTADKLVALTTANPAVAIIASAGQMSGIIGICDSSLGTCGTTGTATVINYGDHNCIFDATGATAGHYVGPSTLTAGACADVGAMSSGGLLVIGRVYSNCTGGADCKINFLSTSDILNNGGVASAVTFNTLPNASSIGTTTGKLALITSNTMQTIGTTATAGVQGICTANCGTGAPNPTINVTGATPCVVAASATPGDYAVADTVNAGDCADGGSTFPTGGNEVVGTFLSTVVGGKATVMLWGPDVANSSGGGGGGINTGVPGQPAVYGAANTVSPVPGVFHISGTNVTDQIFKVLTATNKCMNASNVPVACDIIVDPGTTDTETGPTLVGYPNVSPGVPVQQTLIIDNAKVTFNGGNANGTNPGSFPQDDGLIIGPNGNLQCIGHGNATAGITNTSGSHLNSIVTTLGGVILNQWQPSTAMARGEFVFDSGSNAVWRILSCTGNCTTGGSNPLAASGNAATIWGTQADNNITWQNIHVGGRLSLTSSNADISGCYVIANQAAQTNNTLRISGILGALAVMRNVAGLGVGTGTGSDDTTGSDAILFDQVQGNGFCTGSGTPLACCPSSCQNGVSGANGAELSVQGLWAQPGGTISSCNVGYLVRFTGTGTGLIDVEGGQISDLGTSCSSTNKLVADMSIDGGARSISFNNFYFEGSSGAGHVPPDDIVINNGSNINFTGTLIGGTGGLTNALHITSTAGTQNVFYRGNIAGTNGFTHAIQNDLSSYTLTSPGTSGLPVVYDYGPTGANTLGYIFDGRNITFNDLLTLPPMSIAACGTCNTTAVPIGSVCYYNNAAACGFSTTAAASGAHTGLAVCNAASNWAEATCN